MFCSVKKPIFLACVFLFYAFSPAEAQKAEEMEQPLQEFFIGETVFSQEKKEFQLTLKPAYSKGEKKLTIAIPLQIEYGITDRFQVALALPYSIHFSPTDEVENDIANTEVEVLYNVLSGNKPFALSVAMELGLPIARKEKHTTETEVAWGPSLIIAKQFGRAQVHVSLGAEITKSETKLDYNLATVLPLGNWRLTCELNGQGHDEKVVYLTPGVIWKGSDELEFGLGITKSVGMRPVSYGFVLMMNYEFF